MERRGVQTCLANPAAAAYMTRERLARAGASPTRSGPEGSSRNEPRLGRCPASHLPYLRGPSFVECLCTQGVTPHALLQNLPQRDGSGSMKYVPHMRGKWACEWSFTKRCAGSPDSVHWSRSVFPMKLLLGKGWLLLSSTPSTSASTRRGRSVSLSDRRANRRFQSPRKSTAGLSLFAQFLIRDDGSRWSHQNAPVRNGHSSAAPAPTARPSRADWLIPERLT